MEKDQIDRLKEIQSYLDYLVGDLTISHDYAYAEYIFCAIKSINEVLHSYKDLTVRR